MTPATLKPEPDGWRTFQWIWGSQGLSVIGNYISGFALSVYLAQTRYPLESQKAELALALSLTGLAWTLAASFATPLAGAWADRYPRQRLMLLGDLASAALTFTMLALVLLPAAPLWALVLVSALSGAVATVHGSAFDAMVSTLVPEEKLPRANGMMQTVWSIGGLAGPALGAVLVGIPALLRPGSAPGWLSGLHDGVPFAYFIDGLTFLFAALVMARLHVPSHLNSAEADPEGHAAPPGNLKDSLKFGWNFIRERPALLYLLLAAATANLCMASLHLLYPLLTKFTLAADWQARGSSLQTALATLTITGSIGGLLGGTLISFWGGLRRMRALGALVPLLVAGLALVLLGRTHLVWLAAAALFLRAFMEPFSGAHMHSIWQARVPAAMQGRVFSVRRLLGQITNPLGAVLIGLIAARSTPGNVALYGGVLMMAVTLLVLLIPAVQRADEVAVPASAAGES